MTRGSRSVLLEGGCWRGAVLLAAAMILSLGGCRGQTRQTTAGEMEQAFDVSFTDYPALATREYKLGITEKETWERETWGERGLENVVDTVIAAGVRRIHFRSHAAGPWWPTKIPDAAPNAIPLKEGLKPTFKEWNAVKAAVQVAHRKGVKLIAWFDLTEGHAGYPTAWALRHPQYTVVRRDGFREDGSQRDPILSFAYPEVVQYRLALLRELFGFGVDGVYLVVNASVGYEKPVRDSFLKQYGVDPGDLAEDDLRWVKHKSRYFTEFLRQVHRLVREQENKTGQRLELTLEGQDREGTPASETGWPQIPKYARMPAYVDVETIAREGLVDCISFWRLSEIDSLSDEVRRRVKLGTRYRWFGFPYGAEGFTEEQYRTRQTEAQKRGVSLFVVNEVRYPLITARWMYPAKPGPLHELMAKSLDRTGPE